MKTLKNIWLVSLLFLLVLSGTTARAMDENGDWAPTPPRLSYIDGEVSFWREGGDEWARARVNLALAEGDALYTGEDANLEVQFGNRSFVRADENTQLSLLVQEEHYIQFKLANGRVSFDLRSMAVGDMVEVSTPEAVFSIEHPGYYRVEVNTSDTHFITRRGGEATLTTADGRSLSIYPSEDIVVTAGNPVRVATYAASAPDAWDHWNDARSDRFGESVSTRYLPPGVYGAEELDHYGGWRVVPTYGSVWIPYGISADWAPYSTGSWVWDPFYEWTWIDDAPWGWAPFHYGRWVYVDGFWAWAPGPVVRRPVYSPALVAFMIRDHDVSARISIGLPGLWWVALSWGEPVLPWWGAPGYRGHPRWSGWGGPRIVNNVVVNQTTVINAGNIRFHNASLPRAILTVPPDRFGREWGRATVETRYRHTDFAPVRGELPVKPVSASLFGGAPKGIQPPREIVARPVVSTRTPREKAPVLKDATPRARTQAIPESRFVIPPVRRAGETRIPTRPPFGAETGPERTPPPRSPSYDEVKKQATPTARPALPVQREPAVPRSQPTIRDQPTPRESTAGQRAAPPSQPTVRAQPAPREPAAVQRVTPPRQPAVAAPTGRSPAPAVQQPVSPREPAAVRSQPSPQRGEVRQEAKERPLPGQPASRVFRGREPDQKRNQ